MFDKIMAMIFPKQKLVIDHEYFPTTINYFERLERIAEPEVHSEVTGPFPMMFVSPVDQVRGRYVGNGREIRWTIVLILALTLTTVGCARTHGPVVYKNVTINTTTSWPVGQAKTCLFSNDSADLMTMHCVAFGDKDRDDSPLYLVDVEFDKPVHNPSGVYGVVCRLDSIKHATCVTEKP